MSRQLDYYHRHRDEILARRRQKRKTSKTPKTTKLSSALIYPDEADLQALALRLHRKQVSYPILNAVSEQKLLSLGLKEHMLNNNTQYLGAGFRVTTQNLELEGIELWAHRLAPSAVIDGIANGIADNLALSLASQYGLRIDIQQRHSPEGLTEVELTQHEMAKRVLEKGIIPVHWNASTHDADVWMDKSFGYGGIESNVFPYIQKLTNMTNDIVDHDGWEQMKANLLEATGLIKYYATNMEAHAKLVKQASRLIGELRKERKRIAKAVPQAQRRL